MNQHSLNYFICEAPYTSFFDGAIETRADRTLGPMAKPGNRRRAALAA
jgi:hypothetical protein